MGRQGLFPILRPRGDVLANRPDPGTREGDRSEVVRRPGEWRPVRRFSSIPSSGLVGPNPAAGKGTVVVLPNLYTWSPRAPAAAVRIETPWTIRVGIFAAAARRRRSTWVVAAIGSPTTRNATFCFAAASRIVRPSSTSFLESTRIFFPTSCSTEATVAPAKPDV